MQRQSHSTGPDRAQGPRGGDRLAGDAGAGPGVESGARRFSVPLKPAVLLVAMLLTVPVLLAIMVINYQSTDRVVTDHAFALVERFRAEAIEDIESEFDELQAQIATAAELGRQEPSFFTDGRSLPYFLRVLLHSDTALNVYAGLEDGSFRQARRLQDPTVAIHDQPPPDGAVNAFRVIETDPLDPEAPLLDRYFFLNAQEEIVGELAAPTEYDPRVRPWYRQAVQADRMITTDAEVFYAFGLVGFTVAEPIVVDGTLNGVVAVDVTLDSFSDYLARNPLSPNSLSYLLDDRGNVLAASDRATTYGGENDDVRLPHITDLGKRLVSLAYLLRPGEAAEDVYPFSFEGQDYLVSLSSFAGDAGKPWRLMVLTPLSDFTAELTENNRHMVIFGLVAVAVQLLVIYIIASRMAQPLRLLSAKVERIRALEPADDLPPVQSSVREIAVLSRAIETLDIAVQAFARFVPVGLVRELLSSEHKLDIGGQSKFLTIFFSDMEGFSALAERIASRELLERISTMLELVSRSVHRERGTIDKFVGDGVMAFWGAPAPLEDHAWHACVAALRVQEELDRLNSTWRSAEAPEMRLRVGIHSDAVLVGNVGSRERMSYTVLGDGVNIAARLESLNKEYGTLITISHDTFREAGDRLCVRPIDEVSVKGRRARITVYELLGAYEAGPELEPTPEMVDLARDTRAAFDALVAGDRAEALALYRKVLERHPQDQVAGLHAARLSVAEGQGAPLQIAEISHDKP
ncbi:adenylate/guanylate cyclase domain-containing protein [Marinibacterium profundimaris]|nr:adenylate/guanylate cyclase domain-containing protein [Marinibacterium profundimaris]